MNNKSLAEFSILLNDLGGRTTVKIRGNHMELMAAIGSVCFEDHDIYLLLKEVLKAVDAYRASEGEDIISNIK
jgi:hypothetical protein